MSSLYLYYQLKITPLNAGSIRIKQSIDLKILASLPTTHKNNQVREYYKSKNLYCPTLDSDNINMCLTEYTIEDYNISILFAEVLNSELITPNLIFDPEKRTLETLFDRHIKIDNDLLSEEFFNCELEVLIKNISSHSIYNLRPIEAEENLNTKLFNYQKDNINWMLDLEKNLLSAPLSENKKYYFPDGRIFNYNQRKFENELEVPMIQIKGGILMDDVGIGKTLQMITLCMSTPDIKTLIIVPDHLQEHWKNQIFIHCKIPMDWVMVCSFSDFTNHLTADRIIIDEIHELYKNNNLLNEMIRYNCLYKWGITATPFTITNGMFNLLKYLTCQEWSYPSMVRMKNYKHIFSQIFRKKTLKNIADEVKLPDLNIMDELIEFNKRDKIVYDAELIAKENCDELTLRRICCDVIMKDTESITGIEMSLDEYKNIVFKDFQTIYETEFNKLQNYKQSFENCKEKYEKYKTEENLHNVRHFQSLVEAQEVTTANRLNAFNFLKRQMEELEYCPICYEDIKDGEYAILQCKHIFCTLCIDEYLKRKHECPMCKQNFDKATTHVITNNKTNISKYSSKIQRLLEVCKNTNEKIIVFTQYPELIEKITNIFRHERISAIKFTSVEDIERYKHEAQVLILSSNTNASGLDLSFIKNIIILEPLIGSYSFMRDIEKQIIGRIHRINQKENANVMRLVIKDSIEEKIYNSQIV